MAGPARNGRLEGKIAIITGAAGGMGEAAALMFAREGAAVAAVDLTDDRVAHVVDAIRAAGGRAIGIGADVSDTADIARLVVLTIAELGVPDILFNNAGVDTEGKRNMLSIDEAAFDRVIKVNLKGPWLMMKAVVPHMIAAGKKGSIINTASIGAFIAASSAGYCASKAGLVGLTKVAAVELGRHGIRVNALCPGATETPLAKSQRAEMEANGLPTSSEIMNRMGVLGRMAQPEEMAAMALFLASDESSFATGASFVNDAGWTAMSGCRCTADCLMQNSRMRKFRIRQQVIARAFPPSIAPRRRRSIVARHSPMRGPP